MGALAAPSRELGKDRDMGFASSQIIAAVSGFQIGMAVLAIIVLVVFAISVQSAMVLLTTLWHFKRRLTMAKRTANPFSCR